MAKYIEAAGNGDLKQIDEALHDHKVIAEAMAQKEVDWDVVKKLILDKDSGMVGLRKITKLRRGLELGLQALKTGSSKNFAPQTVQPD